LPFLVKQMPVSAAVVPLFKGDQFTPAFNGLEDHAAVPTAYPVSALRK